MLDLPSLMKEIKEAERKVDELEAVLSGRGRRKAVAIWMEADTYTQTIQIFQTREGEVHTLKFTRKEAALLAKGLERQCEAMKGETGNVSR